ncbi:hypothetical protein AADZ90_012155 [Aestuariibius sp. 2305UL40-4]|uniref:hypothetical protein n=1 Tax=Aestuariibius violaceus TaxID=3234132 RepID=UPI00345E4BC8
MTEIDPKGVIAEAYRIDGIGPAECRSIFLDWALALPEGADTHAALQDLVARHGAQAPDHPMTAVLNAGLEVPPDAGRRGGRRGRVTTGG